MSINPVFFVTLPAAGILFWIGTFLAKRKSRLCFFVLLILAALTLIIPLPYLLSSLGRQPIYCTLRAVPFIEAAISLSALPAGFLFNIEKKKIVTTTLLPLFLVMYISIPFAKSILLPLNPESLPTERWSQDVCIQSGATTCGPASLATIMRAMGMEKTEREIARGSYTGLSGTENWYLARYAKTLGLTASFSVCGSIEDVPVYSIIGVEYGTGGHFVTVLPGIGEKLVIGDPLKGRLELSADEFNEKYIFSGFVLSFEKK